MRYRWSIGTVSLAAFLCLSLVGARAFDDSKYPDLSGQWLRVNLGKGGQVSFDPTKSWGLGQEAPLTPEYEAILRASIADQENGGQGNWNSGARCLPPGMPATMMSTIELSVLACRSLP